VTPFLRWAGGKRWLAPRLAPILASRSAETYFEPFLGSAALFFELRPLRAVLSDINEELINSYKTVKKSPTLVAEMLRSLPVDPETFYRIRQEKNVDLLKRAIRFIYLNRTCYGGLHRTNRAGQFNTPYGGGSRTPEPLWRDGLLLDVGRLLARRGVKLGTNDFEKSLNMAGHGDVVYCDPVYTTQIREQFDRYNSQLFGWDEQIRLSEAAYRAAARGALVLISNAYSKDIKNIYKSAFRIALERKKSIGQQAKGLNRGIEYLIVLDPEERRNQWLSLGSIERRARASSSRLKIDEVPFVNHMPPQEGRLAKEAPPIDPAVA
jgi:DNA adenine methylase